MRSPSTSAWIPVGIDRYGSIVDPELHDAVVHGIEFSTPGEVVLRTRTSDFHECTLRVAGVFAVGFDHVGQANVIADAWVLQLRDIDERVLDLQLAHTAPNWRDRVDDRSRVLQFEAAVGLKGVVLCSDVTYRMGAEPSGQATL